MRALEATQAGRVAMRWQEARNKHGESSPKDGGDDSKKPGWDEWLETEGDKIVKNPDTGNDAQVRSLKGPKGKALRLKMFQAWSAQTEESEAAEKDKAKKDESAGRAGEDPNLNKPLPIDPKDHPVPEDGMPAKGGPVREVQDSMAKGKPPTKSLVQTALGLVSRALGIGAYDKKTNSYGLKDDEIEKIQKTEKWLRDLAGVDKPRKKIKPKVKSEPKAKPSALKTLAEKHNLKPEDVEALKQHAEQADADANAEAAPHKALKKKHKLEQKVMDAVPKRLESIQKKLDSDFERATKEHENSLGAKAKYEDDKAAYSDAKSSHEKAKAKHEKAKVRYEKAKTKYDEDLAKFEKDPETTPEPKEPVEPKAPKPPKEPKPPKNVPKPKKPTKGDAYAALKEEEPDLADVPDEDLEVLAKPKKEKSLGQRQKDFLKSVKDPEMKERVQEMDPDEFGEFLAAISKERTASMLRAATIRLAYSRPDLQRWLVPLLGE